MGRTAKHNWAKLFLEFCQGKYKSARQFAEKKKLNYDSVKKEFRKLQNEAENGGEITPKDGDKKGQKKSPPKERWQNHHSWELIKSHFADWPDDKLQAYVVQLTNRKRELEAIPFEELTPEEIAELGQVRRERRAILSEPDPDKICKAVRRGKKCNNPVERGMEVCWNHGGAAGTGSSYSNPTNLKHGAYQTIWLDQLDDEERELVHQVAQDKIRALEEEIILLTVRERRMMARIAELQKYAFTVVEEETTSGIDKNKGTELSTQKKAGTLGQIQVIEEHLTKVQDKKLKAIELKHKLETTDVPDDEGSLDELARAIEESRRVMTDAGV